METISTLTAISPIDGRYYDKTRQLSKYFSESALIKYRLRVEIEYFMALCEIPLKELSKLKKAQKEKIRGIASDTQEAVIRIKELEKITNHDVKAVEYFIKEHFDQLGLSQYKEFVHFGLTSQDINNTALPMALKEAIDNLYLPKLEEIRKKLNERVKEWKNISMLSHTHGQPASPTKLGKEINVFVSRLDGQIKLLQTIPYCGKFGGAVGNLNAHYVAYPEIDWNKFANEFLKKRLGLKRSYPTTQIEHYDNLAALLDNIKRINTILNDFSKDMWLYISMNYFGQKTKKNEVGSSTMPHKINPIEFENAEGNLGIANALLEHLSSKLPISRLQRDLTDSTVLRNLGVCLGYTLIAFSSLTKGIEKLTINKEVIANDLMAHPEVLAEAIQTILRREQIDSPYEKLKELTRKGESTSLEQIGKFIDKLEVSDKVKRELKSITPDNYTGK